MIKIMELEVKLPKHAKEVTANRTIMEVLLLRHAREQIAIKIMGEDHLHP